jgi:hypothetical protein
LGGSVTESPLAHHYRRAFHTTERIVLVKSRNKFKKKSNTNIESRIQIIIVVSSFHHKEPYRLSYTSFTSVSSFFNILRHSNLFNILRHSNLFFAMKKHGCNGNEQIVIDEEMAVSV